MDEERAYARAADELETDELDKATWARAFAESDGDTPRTKARYITLRVRKLTQQEPVSASVIGEQIHSDNAQQSSPVDSGYNREIPDVKDRLWQEAQTKALGHPVNADKTSAQEATPANNNASAGQRTSKSESDVTALYKAVIGEKNTSYYLTKFGQFDRQGPGLKASWNWPAFLVGGAWTLYRKMYAWFFVFLATTVLWGMSGRGTFLNAAFFVFAIAFAVFSNSLYHRHVSNKILNSKGATTSYQAQLNRLHSEGGVHGWVIWVTVGLPLVGILAAIIIPVQLPSATVNATNQQSSSNDLVKRAELGDAQAQYQMAVAFAKGEGGAQDYAEAAKWYRKAAEQGHAKSQMNLGRRYYFGQGVPQDYSQAAYWFRKAAEQGNPDAQNQMGVVFAKGEGVAQDYAEAAKWYRKAAEQGQIYAQNNLAVIYATQALLSRYEEPQLLVAAYMWHSLALAGAPAADRERIAQSLGFLEGRLTPLQKTQAQELTRDWLAKHQR